MNEIKLIHLGRTAFTIAVDAHTELRAYLAAIKKYADADVIEEVEIRMAELLSERGFDEKKVILSADIEYLKSQLGEPKDFGESEDDDTTIKNSDTNDTVKRLYRNTDEGWLGGVASGLASYVGVAPWIIRIAFILLTFAWGTSILVYIILWILLPEAKTPSDRLRMQGKSITVDTLKDYIAAQEGSDDIRSTVKSFADGTWHETPRGTTFGNAMQRLVRVGLAVVGVAVMVGALMGIFAAIGFGTFGITNADRIFGGVALFPVGATETWIAILGIVVVVLMGILLAMSGLSLVREKWPAPGWVTGSIIGVVLVGLAVIVPFGASVAPKVEQRYNDAHVTTTRKLDAFSNLIVQGNSTTVRFEPSTTYEVIIKSYDKNTLPDKVISGVHEGTLTLRAGTTSNTISCDILCVSLQDIQIIVRAPKIDRLDVRDEANFSSESRLNQQNLTVVADRGSSASFAYIVAERAVVFDENNRQGITLTGLGEASQDDSLYHYESFSLTKSNEVVYEQTKLCQADQPIIELPTAVSNITIGTQKYLDSEVFKNDRKQFAEKTATINCINQFGDEQ